MNALTVPDLSDEAVAELARRAAEHGVSVADEARRLLEAALPVVPSEAPTKYPSPSESFPTSEDDAPDWIFDRHDLRYRQQWLPAGADFKAHLLALGEVGADIRLDWPRSVAEHRAVEL